MLRTAGGSLLVTTDTLVEGVDFDLSYASGSDVGFKSISAGVSDVAAMGGVATRVVVSVSLPPETPLSVADALGEGIAEAAGEYGIGVAGGDISAASELSVTATVVGEPPGSGEAVLRSGARPGDVVCVTGTLGASAGGLFVLSRGLAQRGVAVAPERREAFARLAHRHLRPRARAGAGAALAGVASAMIDVSDGLAVDLGHLTSASGVGCRIDIDRLPVDPDLEPLAATVTDGSVDPVATAITGGEDLELLFCVRPERLEAARAAAAAAGLSEIGAIVEGGRKLGEDELDSWIERGFEHLT